jgi:hypothetical protein
MKNLSLREGGDYREDFSCTMAEMMSLCENDQELLSGRKNAEYFKIEGCYLSWLAGLEDSTRD